MQTYYYVLGSHKFLLEEEPLEEVLRERERNYREQEKEIDFSLQKKTIGMMGLKGVPGLLVDTESRFAGRD